MKRLLNSSSRTIFRWIRSPAGVRTVFVLLWLASVVIVAEYAIRKTVDVLDLAQVRMINQAATSCELAEEAFNEERAQYAELMKMADRCVVWKQDGPSF